MTNLKLDFYSEVIIKDSCPNDLLENGETIKGKKGVVLGGLLYTAEAADYRHCVVLGGVGVIKKRSGGV
ncbi:hypothetical protein, partial [Neisseria meningitidis]|uniref:hypothetical protein n=1 Tax=Neisseria meningitidis TaxID=487 RepID=UPI000A37DF41